MTASLPQAHPFHTSRLILRALEPEDDLDFYHRIQTDAFGFRNSNGRVARPQKKKDTKDFLEWCAAHTLICVVICLQPAEEQAHNTSPLAAAANAPSDAVPTPRDNKQPAALTPIGAMHLGEVSASSPQRRCTEVGIDILPAFQGRGYGSEALRWLVDWAFDAACLHRVEIAAFEYNVAARRCYERLGFVPEGADRKNVWQAGRWWDTYRYAVLEEEWAELRKGRGEGI